MRRYLNGQRILKYPQVTNHHEKANQNQNEISSYTCYLFSKTEEITNVGKNVEKGNSCTLLERMQTGRATIEKHMECSQKIKNITFDPQSHYRVSKEYKITF